MTIEEKERFDKLTDLLNALTELFRNKLNELESLDEKDVVSKKKLTEELSVLEVMLKEALSRSFVQRNNLREIYSGSNERIEIA